MLTKSRAIVLRSFKYGEQQMIVQLFTEEAGKLSFITRISKSRNTRIKVQLFQPMTLIYVVFDYRSTANLQRMKEAGVSRAFETVGIDPYKTSIVLFLSEFLCHATRDVQKDKMLFAYVANSILWLDHCRGSFANFHLVFMIHLTRFLGFYPNLYAEDGDNNDYFDMRNGCFCREVPVHPYYLSPAEAAKMRLLMRMDYATMHLFSMSRQERNRCLDVIIEFYRLHLPDFPELKSLAVLRELFS